jgi:tRNA (guanine-N7-)-methyltransferase
MARQKLKRFLHNTLAENVIEKGKPLYTSVKGNWNKVYFQNDNPIVLELACGKGEYTTGFAGVFPEKNYIGIDVKGDRIQRGSKRAIDNNLNNVAFLRAGIQYMDEFFEIGEVDEIWLIHPDPQPKDKDEKKRLTNPNFLSLYAKYMKQGGHFLFKTDNPFLYE